MSHCCTKTARIINCLVSNRVLRVKDGGRARGMKGGRARGMKGGEGGRMRGMKGERATGMKGGTKGGRQRIAAVCDTALHCDALGTLKSLISIVGSYTAE